MSRRRFHVCRGGLGIERHHAPEEKRVGLALRQTDALPWVEPRPARNNYRLPDDDTD